MGIICKNEKFVVPLHPISRQTEMAAETIASLAQLVEHSICNQAVVGSSPTRGSSRSVNREKENIEQLINENPKSEIEA